MSIGLWPIAALVFAYDHFTVRSVRFGKDRVYDQRAALVSAADRALPTYEFFAFREAVERYTGICEALESPIGASSPAGMFEIGGIPEPPAYRSCVIRRNRGKLYMHRADARVDFLIHVAAALSRDPQILDLARGLASLLDDHVAVDELDSPRYQNGNSVHISSDRISIAA